jgi:hypothetical protein
MAGRLQAYRWMTTEGTFEGAAGQIPGLISGSHEDCAHSRRLSEPSLYLHVLCLGLRWSQRDTPMLDLLLNHSPTFLVGELTLVLSLGLFGVALAGTVRERYSIRIRWREGTRAIGEAARRVAGGRNGVRAGARGLTPESTLAGLQSGDTKRSHREPLSL